MASSTPGPIAFTLIDFPHTNNAEMEIASVLEQRLVDVNDDVQFFSARKEMLLTFDSANDAHTGRMFSDDIKLTSLAGAYKKFIDICAEGLPWAIEFGNAVGPQGALEMDLVSPKRDFDRVGTPSYANTGNTDSKKAKTSEIIINTSKEYEPDTTKDFEMQLADSAPA